MASFTGLVGMSPVSVDVRIIAATHQDLEKRVAEGQFREDLYHRLNVIRIHLPKLADRSEDVVLLAQHFLDKAAKELQVESKMLSKETQKVLSKLPWPGNVRQLENVCRWITVMATSKEIQPEDLPPEIHNQPVSVQSANSDATWQQLLVQLGRFAVAVWQE